MKAWVDYDYLDHIEGGYHTEPICEWCDSAWSHPGYGDLCSRCGEFARIGQLRHRFGAHVGWDAGP